MVDETKVEEQVRLGRPYWQCRSCPYSTNDRGYIERHVRDHEPHPSLEEVLAPAPEPVAPARRRRES